jgi:hypothetical protein
MTLTQAIAIASVSASLSTAIALYATANMQARCNAMPAVYDVAINAVPKLPPMPKEKKL